MHADWELGAKGIQNKTKRKINRTVMQFSSARRKKRKQKRSRRGLMQAGGELLPTDEPFNRFTRRTSLRKN